MNDNFTIIFSHFHNLCKWKHYLFYLLLGSGFHRSLFTTLRSQILHSKKEKASRYMLLAEINCRCYFSHALANFRINCLKMLRWNKQHFLSFSLSQAQSRMKLHLHPLQCKKAYTLAEQWYFIIWCTVLPLIGFLVCHSVVLSCQNTFFHIE